MTSSWCVKLFCPQDQVRGSFWIYVDLRDACIVNASRNFTGNWPQYMHHTHDDVIKWKHFPRNWPFVRGIHRSPVNSPHKGQWRGAVKFSLIYVWINGWVNNREAGDLRRYLVHYDVTVMCCFTSVQVPVKGENHTTWSMILFFSIIHHRYCLQAEIILAVSKNKTGDFYCHSHLLLMWFSS